MGVAAGGLKAGCGLNPGLTPWAPGNGVEGGIGGFWGGMNTLPGPGSGGSGLGGAGGMGGALGI